MIFGQNMYVRSKKALKNVFFLYNSQNTPPRTPRMIKILLFLDWLVGNNLAWASQQKTYADLRIWFIFFPVFRITLKEVVKLAHFLVFSGPKWLGKASMKTKTQFCISVWHQVHFGAFKFDIFGFCEFFLVGGHFWLFWAIFGTFWTNL